MLQLTQIPIGKVMLEDEDIVLETRKVEALEAIAFQLRKLASPTPDEIRETLQQRIDTAVFLDVKRPESSPLN